MDTKLIFTDATGFSTPMLALFAVDLATGRDAEPRPLLLTSSSDLADATARAMGPGEFKAKSASMGVEKSLASAKISFVFIFLSYSAFIPAIVSRFGSRTVAMAARPVRGRA